MKGIIIDGVSATGKSTILRGIQKSISKAYPDSTRLFLSEHFIQRMLEHLAQAGKLTTSDAQSHVDAIIYSIQTFAKMYE